MSKRRRIPSIASRSVDEDTNESDSQSLGAMETSRKKRKLDPFELMQNLYDTIRSFKKEDGTLLCDAFIRVPKRRQEPGYYDVVTNPIDLLKIQQKLKTEEYDDVEDMQTDMELLVNNAKSFYKRSSQEYKDANELWDLFLQTKARIFETCDEVVGENKAKIIIKNRRLTNDTKKQESMEIEESSTESWATSNEDELSMCEELFSAVLTATDPDSRPIYPVFQLLPSRKRYPKYYTIIENPIDLRTIARKIQDGKYTSLNDMEKDLLLMTKNACTFNEPGSQIYKDAKMLKKIISSRKIEIEHGKSVLEKKSERIRNKRLRGSSQSLSAITAALHSEDDDSDADDDVEQVDDSIEEEPDNPRWQLYNAIRTYTNAQGICLAEPFLKLPSKRYYANYYKEIRNPLSLFQIRKKLINGHYGTVSEVAGDLNILFENTKKFNKPDTKLYKDAVKLQKVMQAKVQELLDFQHQYSESEEESTDEPTAAKRIKVQKNPGRGKYSNNIPLKRRLYALCKCLMDYVTEDGRQPMLMFMEKPSKKLYPDYYKVILEPIDMLTIENNIRLEKYTAEEEILRDFKLMFRNCREYNEEGSLIYEDAITLERVLMDFIKDGTTSEKRTPAKIVAQIPSPAIMRTKKLPLPPPTPTMMKMRTLFSTIKDYKDPKGRQLSVIFNKLPSKIEYPDYYEVIKRPINLEIISQKLKGNCYENLEDLVSDFVLMFDNAFKYNEPDSQIYKDALVLQRVTLQTKLQLREDEDTVPDVPSAVQELLTSLFTAVYNHQDEEGRCFSDSLAELPEHDEVDGKKIRALSLDLIKRRLDSGQYRRLDMFQDEMFSCFERARRFSRTDSQVFEDSIELQSYFIRQRDELCRNGDLLNSPALNYTLFDLSGAVNSVRDAKSAEECADSLIKEEENEPAAEESVKEEEEDGSSVIQSTENSVGAVDNAMSYNQQVYRIGDFVYAESKERGQEWMILNIQRLWIGQDNQQMMYGNQYYRPSETYHVTTRRFLEKEVFKTDQHMSLPLSCIKGRCAVLSVKDYFRFKPDGFDDKDVYVCESRYSTRARLFKKIKSWPPGLTNVCKLIEREEPLEPKRTVSVYRDRVEKHKEEIAELEEQEKYVEKEKPNVETVHSNNTDENCTYYEQYNVQQCLIKTGDCVYLRNENNNTTSRTLICQINKIWTTKEEKAFIYGPWLVLPSDVPHPPNKLFYKQEILLSTLENTNEVSQIVGKCAVLEHSEYISCRPTEIPESEVYICESMFDEARQQIIDLPKDGLKKFVHSPAVYQDEIYFFRRLINPTKVNATGEPEQTPTQPEKTQISVQNEVNFQSCNSSMVKVEPPDVGTEDSMDGGPPSVCSSDMGAPSTPNSNSNFTITPHTGKKKRGNCDITKSKQVTGYILYSSDVRRTVTQSNPNRTFGEVSRIVGNEWKKLSQAEKNIWEEKAQRINEETQSKIEKGEIVLTSTSNSLYASFVGPTLPDHVWECLWNNCDFMFEDQVDCLEHAVGDSSGHVASTFAGISTSGAEYQCQWRACPRIKKNAPPFPSLHRLMRHVKEVHILKSLGRVCPPSDRSKHYVASKYARNNSVNTVTSSASSSDNALSHSPAISTTTAVSSVVSLTTTVSTSAANTGLPVRDSPSPVVHNVTNGTTINPVAPKRTVEPLFVVVPPKPHRILHSDIYLNSEELRNETGKNQSTIVAPWAGFLPLFNLYEMCSALNYGSKYIEGLSTDKPTQVSSWEKQFYATPESVPSPDSRLPVQWLGNGVGNHGNVLNALWALRDYMMRDALNISKVI